MRRTMLSLCLATFAFVAVGCGGAGGNEAANVARGFWDALEAGDIETAKTFATTSSASSLQMTENMQDKDISVTLGEIVDEEGTTFVETTVATRNEETEMDIPMKTVLVQENDEWKVDVDQTMMSLFGGAMAEMMKGMGEAMGEAMQGMGEEVGKAMQEGMEGMGEGMTQPEEETTGEGSGS